MIHTINFTITCDGATRVLNSYSALSGLHRCAEIRIAPVRGRVSNPGYVIGLSGVTMHEILAPAAGQPLDYWVGTPDIAEGNPIKLNQISFKGTSGDVFNVSIVVCRT